MNPELVTYVRAQFDAGIDRETIRKNLLQNGWSEADVTSAFGSAETFVTKQGFVVGGVVPATKPRPRNTMLWVGLLVLILILAAAGFYFFASSSVAPLVSDANTEQVQQEEQIPEIPPFPGDEAATSTSTATTSTSASVSVPLPPALPE